MTKKRETEKQFLRRVDRTAHKAVKDGGPTYAELQKAISLKLKARTQG